MRVISNTRLCRSLVLTIVTALSICGFAAEALAEFFEGFTSVPLVVSINQFVEGGFNDELGKCYVLVIVVGIVLKYGV